jgi:hypothetical protein
MSDKPPIRTEPLSPVQVQMLEDLQWGHEHYNELDQLYHGEVVGIWKKQVVGHAPDEEELVRQLTGAGLPRQEVAFFYLPAFFETPH